MILHHIMIIENKCVESLITNRLCYKILLDLAKTGLVSNRVKFQNVVYVYVYELSNYWFLFWIEF